MSSKRKHKPDSNKEDGQTEEREADAAHICAATVGRVTRAIKHAHAAAQEESSAQRCRAAKG